MSKLWFSAFSLLFLFGASFASTGRGWQEGRCQISSINAQEPSYTLQAQGGVTEFYDYNNAESRCAGLSIRRHRIKPRGLLLPLYHNAPVVLYTVKGNGLYAVMISGCPETFEYSQPQGSPEYPGKDRSQTFRDRHQKIEELRPGDFVAVTAGAAHWIYNNGNQELVVVAFHHNSNDANQLDENPRSFLLAGKPQSQKGQSLRGQSEFGNLFAGLAPKILAEAFKSSLETANKLRGDRDGRGHIALVNKDLEVIRPSYSREEEYRQGEDYQRHSNGLDETICTARIKENLDRPSRADIYNPRAGRFSTFNRNTLPILNFLRLSAARGVLYRNAIMSPLWYTNAHSALYATRGEARIQIVNHRGQAVYDGRVREGQVLVIPQYFAVLKQAGKQGFEWVEFNTNEEARINTLSGRTSAMRALPVDVIANAYQISWSEAEKLKNSRRETLMFSGNEQSGRVAAA